jgi:hypothetical protein
MLTLFHHSVAKPRRSGCKHEDIRPFTELAAGLVAGHDVTLAVTDNAGRDYRGLARRSGYQFVVVDGPSRPSAEESERVRREFLGIGNPILQSELGWIAVPKRANLNLSNCSSSGT